MFVLTWQGVQLCPTATAMQQDLHALELPAEHFDGIFANAVLFHVPSCLRACVRCVYTRPCPLGEALSTRRSTREFPSDDARGQVERTELKRVLCELVAAVKPGGVIFVSNPRSMQVSPPSQPCVAARTGFLPR